MRTSKPNEYGKQQNESSLRRLVGDCGMHGGREEALFRFHRVALYGQTMYTDLEANILFSVRLCAFDNLYYTHSSLIVVHQELNAFDVEEQFICGIIRARRIFHFHSQSIALIKAPELLLMLLFAGALTVPICTRCAVRCAFPSKWLPVLRWTGMETNLIVFRVFKSEKNNCDHRTNMISHLGWRLSQAQSFHPLANKATNTIPWLAALHTILFANFIKFARLEIRKFACVARTQF